jgi:hypothetical protein
MNTTTVHKVGNVYEFIGFYYILAQVYHNKKTVRVCLIGMKDGFPWSEVVTVKDPDKITHEEWIKIIGGKKFVQDFAPTSNPIKDN